jgi:hypothetical protein
MKLPSLRFLMLIALSLLLMACSPHPSTGVWKATAENDMGIDRLVVGFEGRAEFVSKKPEATWHCFWGKQDEKILSFDCTPSNDPDQKKAFTLTAIDLGSAELREGTKLLATFTRLDENPSPQK